MDIIIFAVIAVVLLIKFASILGKEDGMKAFKVFGKTKKDITSNIKVENVSKTQSHGFAISQSPQTQEKQVQQKKESRDVADISEELKLIPETLHTAYREIFAKYPFILPSNLIDGVTDTFEALFDKISQGELSLINIPMLPAIKSSIEVKLLPLSGKVFLLKIESVKITDIAFKQQNNRVVVSFGVSSLQIRENAEGKRSTCRVNDIMIFGRTINGRSNNSPWILFDLI